MRALYRVIGVCQHLVQEFSDTIGGVLNKFIEDVAKEESDLSQNYIYILFETTALTIKYMRGNNEMFAGLQSKLSDSLNFIIENNKTEFIGFAFQMYSLFVAGSSQNTELYQALFMSCI
jgi:hypothetical protein